MIKLIVGAVMLIWGCVLLLVFNELIIGNIWIVGSIVVNVLPDRRD